MIKREAEFTILLRHYLRANPFKVTTWYEVKQSQTHSIPFSSVKEHQLDWLIACKHGTTNYKIPDDSRGIKPVDGIFSKNTDAVIIIKYPTCFCIIDIDVFISEKANSKSKSLSAVKAEEISIITLNL